VVDDALGRVGVADEVTETGFGDASSVVVELPTDPNAARVTLPSVLVADEDAATRKVLRRAFEDRGYRVVEASDGVTALRLVKEEAPDLLVLDAMLRELHGFDLAKRLKSSDRYGHIPIVLTSATRRGRRFAEDAKASYGIEELVDKPFHADDVIKPLEAARARARASAEGGAAASAEAERLLAAGIAAYKAGDLERAIDFLVKGTHVDPLAFRLRFHLGLLFGKKGQLFDAIQELETAIDLHGGHFAALKNLALVYQKAGFRNKAIETWEKALAAATDDATRRSIREHLLRLL
jgi:CheY-like chemotaxis protein